MDRNKNGTFKEGTVPNPIGRPKGSLNNSNKELREFFSDFLKDNQDKIKEDFENLEPRDRLRFVVEVSKFVIPSLKSIDLTTKEVNLTPEEREKRIKELIAKAQKEL